VQRRRSLPVCGADVGARGQQHVQAGPHLVEGRPGAARTQGCRRRTACSPVGRAAAALPSRRLHSSLCSSSASLCWSQAMCSAVSPCEGGKVVEGRAARAVLYPQLVAQQRLQHQCPAHVRPSWSAACASAPRSSISSRRQGRRAACAPAGSAGRQVVLRPRLCGDAPCSASAHPVTRVCISFDQTPVPMGTLRKYFRGDVLHHI